MPAFLLTAWGFAKGLPWKAIGIGVAIVALAGLIVVGIDKVKDGIEDIRVHAYNEGQQQAAAAFQQTRAEEARQSLTRFAQQVEVRDKAIQAYLADIAARQPLVLQTSREIDRYASTDPGGSICLDADGVRLLQQARSLATAAPGSAAANPRP